jgi:GTP-binding protein
MDPVKAFEIIEGELAAFSDAMTEKPMIVVATKLDATTDRTRLEELKKFCGQKGLEFHAISAPTGEGLKALVRAMADALDRIPKQELTEDEAIEAGDENMKAAAYEDPHDPEPHEGSPPIAKIS